MPVAGASKQIQAQVLTWEGVESQPHRFGGIAFTIGRREIGHIHGDWLVDIPFPRKVRDELVAAALVEPHHIMPESGWISLHLEQDEQVARAIALLRRSYELARKQRGTGGA